MENIKQLAVWMDHSKAQFMELSDEKIVENGIVLDFTHEEKEESLSKSEKGMHNREQYEQSAFYKKIGDTIRNYQEVLLFGPTGAKDELFNLIKDKPQFENIKIEVKHSDKMTENQIHAFVREYFK